MPDRAAYEKLCAWLEQTALLESSRRLLGWDQETYMPVRGADFRARQLALLAGLAHRRHAAPELGDLLAAAAPFAEAQGEDSVAAANVREARRDHDRAIRVPVELVEERARTTALARRAWVDARARADFAAFAPWLERVLDLSRRIAEALGHDGHLYDALLDDYEPGCTRTQLDALFAPLRARRTALLDRIRGATPVDASCLAARCEKPAQEALVRRLLEALGFAFDAGRLDPTVHPFCMGIGPGDVRLTTRWETDDLAVALFGTLHEAGHGLYEQGLDPAEFGRPAGQACSLGVHESQSRLVENAVGRSRGFWRRFLPDLRAAFPGAFEDVGVPGFFRAVNAVSPGPIRVDADEVTYDLHIVLRYELEVALLDRELAVADLPGAWSDRCEALLGVRPADDAEGCLQDVHWSAGFFGYFPTYTLGNVYAAQLADAARRELGDLDEAFAAGTFAPLVDWLRARIHRHGRRFAPARLVERATGAAPAPDALERRLAAKFADVYGLAAARGAGDAEDGDVSREDG